MIDDDLVITVSDLRAVRKGDRSGYCIPGVNRWAAANGFPVKKLLSEGLPVRLLNGKRDPFINELIQVARARLAAEKGE